MDKELREMLVWINENLKAMVSNQTVLYRQLRNIEIELKQIEKEKK